MLYIYIDYDNRIICRYSYCVGDAANCTAEGSSDGDSGTDKLFEFMALVITFIIMMI